jgi:hypothetical protein
MLIAILLFLPLCVYSQTTPAGFAQNCSPKNVDSVRADAGVGAIAALIHSLRKDSFPELARVDLGVRSFHSESDYFRTRFSLSRFVLLERMRYYVEVNPVLFQQQPLSEGVCAILAHELSHVVSLSRGNRIRRFGLVRLLSKRSTAKFERGTDLEAIHRGYGDGLKSYRVWVYAHVPPDKLPPKLRNYFSPDEITAIQMKMQANPDLFAYWTKHVPENLKQIEKDPK